MKLNMPYSWNRNFLRILNGRALARMITMRWMNIFRCTTVNLQSVHTLYTKFNESMYTMCIVYTHCVHRKFDKFRRKARKQHILEFPYVKVIRQTVVTQPPAYISYVKLTNHPNYPNQPGGKTAFFSCPSQQKSVKIRQNSVGCTAAGVHSTVYTLCVHTHYTHANNLTISAKIRQNTVGCTAAGVHNIVYTQCVHTQCTHVNNLTIWRFLGPVPYGGTAWVHDAWRHCVSGVRVHVVDSRPRCFFRTTIYGNHNMFLCRPVWKYSSYASHHTN